MNERIIGAALAVLTNVEVESLLTPEKADRAEAVRRQRRNAGGRKKKPPYADEYSTVTASVTSIVE
jgi:hypothetical protein